jgi:biotin transport system substrate-specific component
VLLYLVEAVAGMPVLAANADGSHFTGLQVLGLTLGTGGYLWGFVLAAGLVGWLSRRGWDRSFRTAVSAMLLGEIVIFAVGVPWLIASIHVPLEKGLEFGLYPFIVGDVVKLLLAAGLLPAAWGLLKRFRPREG